MNETLIITSCIEIIGNSLDIIGDFKQYKEFTDKIQIQIESLEKRLKANNN